MWKVGWSRWNEDGVIASGTKVFVIELFAKIMVMMRSYYGFMGKSCNAKQLPLEWSKQQFAPH